RRAFGVDCAVWRSADGGSTWSKIVNGLPPAGENLGRIAIALAPSVPSRLYASVITGAASGYGGWGLYRSDDAGEDWVPMAASTVQQQAFGGFGWYFGLLEVAPNNPDDVWLGGVELYRTTDGGATLLDVTGAAHVDHHALWVDPLDASRVYLGNDGGFYWLLGSQWQKALNL